MSKIFTLETAETERVREREGERVREKERERLPVCAESDASSFLWSLEMSLSHKAYYYDDSI